MPKKIIIEVDTREKESGLCDLFDAEEIQTQIKYLKRGDYVINSSVTIERKTAEDFIASIVDDRLFCQCANLRKYESNPILLIEGNPYKTKHDMQAGAIQGAIICINVCWHIPIIFSTNKEHSAALFLMVGRQKLVQQAAIKERKGYNPKTIKNKKLYVLQGLPGIGPKLAKQLLQYFGSVEKVMCSSKEQLCQMPGIGKIMSQRIIDVVQS